MTTKNKRHPVAIVSYPPFSSGVTQYSFYLLKGIVHQKKSCEAFLICNRHDRYDTEITGSIASILERTRFLPLSVVKLLHFIWRRKIKIVHFQSFFFDPVLTYCLVIIFKQLNIKIVFTAHDIFRHYQKTWDANITKKIYKLVDRIIVHSETNRLNLLENVSELGTPVCVIPHPLYDNFVKTGRIDQEIAKAQLGIAEDKKVLLFFGRIDRRKGAEVFIREFSKLTSQHSDLCLVFAGKEGFPEGYLRDIAEKEGVLENIVFENRFIEDSEVPLFFSAAHAVILPYLRGSTSGVLKIAIAHKTPVIATAVGELPETIAVTHSGITINLPMTLDDIQAIGKILQNEDTEWLYKDYDNTLDFFSWNSAAKKTIFIYSRAVGIE